MVRMVRRKKFFHTKNLVEVLVHTACFSPTFGLGLTTFDESKPLNPSEDRVV
jgi:hypothetical protein